MMCRIKNLNIDILDKNTSPVFQNKPFPNKNTFFEEFTINAIEKSQSIHQTTKIKPSSTFFAASSSSVTSSSSSNSKRNLDEPIYRSCAVVPNSAALDGSEHGIDIGTYGIKLLILLILNWQVKRFFILFQIHMNLS